MRFHSIRDGADPVDVALQKATIKIACEIHITSTVEWELGNIEKCLKANFNHIAVVSPESRQLRKLHQAAIERWGESEQRICCCSPEELFAFLETSTHRAPKKALCVGGR